MPGKVSALFTLLWMVAMVMGLSVADAWWVRTIIGACLAVSAVAFGMRLERAVPARTR